MQRQVAFAALLFCMAASIPSCKNNDRFAELIAGKIIRDESRRVVVTGRADLPDGTWLYIETIADPEGLRGVSAEAFPVASQTFIAVTPFTAPLKYTAQIVASPALNPGLGKFLDARPQKPGDIIRRHPKGKEWIFKIEASFGDKVEQREFRNDILDEFEESLRTMTGDFKKLQNDAWLADAPELMKRFGADVPVDVLVYSVKSADLLSKAQKDLDSLLLLRMKSMSEKSQDAKKEEKSVAKVRRRLDRVTKELLELRRITNQ